MGYTKANFQDIPPYEQDKEALYPDTDSVDDAMHLMADHLECESLEFTIAKANPGWRAAEHSHPDPPLEEVYHLIEGEATVTVDGEHVDMESGDAIRIDPNSTRAIESDTECSWVFVTGPL